MEAYLLLLALVIIMVCFFIGKEFQHIAEMKGHNGSKYFWWCFLFSVIGMLMVVALPDRSGKAEVTNASNDELPDL